MYSADTNSQTIKSFENIQEHALIKIVVTWNTNLLILYRGHKHINKRVFLEAFFEQKRNNLIE